MGNQNKKYVVISGLNLNDNNRGTAALGYGALLFLRDKGYLSDNQELVNFRIFVNFLKPSNWQNTQTEIEYDVIKKTHYTLKVFFLEYLLLLKFGISFPFTKFGKAIRNISVVAAINGGDGFSDIYDDKTFYSRLYDSKIAMKRNIPLILLPQTIGPFDKKNNLKIAEKILRYSQKIYVRDDKFVKTLQDMGLAYEKTKDLSYYMKPQKWNFRAENNAIGINISGLAYSNHFRALVGQFDCYPQLIERLIVHFQEKGNNVYLIPHSYHSGIPEVDNDDIVACQLAYDKLPDKKNVILVNNNLTSPQVKYVISKMKFFIGTRMHANFAAIYTGVPVFGLAYSYKFKGAFDANGLDGNKQVVMINNIKNDDINNIISKIDFYYNSNYK